MTLTIVIATIQRDSLLTCIEALRGQKYDEIIIVNDMEGNLSRARNRGINSATSDLVAFIDDDTIPLFNFVEQGKAYFENNKKLALMQGKVTGQVETSDEIFFVGANLWVRRVVAKQIGGFDEEFIKNDGYEDLDFCWRIADQGGQFCYGVKCINNHPGKAGHTKTQRAEDILKRKHPKRFSRLMSENSAL